MSIVSYAQNFEDVMLWRALGHVSNGFYIDVGAQHPVVDSVSKAFYEHGWRGIHVEATPTYSALLRQDRPDETVIQAAVNDVHGAITFYEIPETGISTGDADIAEGHKARGFDVHKITVPCITLADVFAQAGQRDIHWLKVDVEGMEPQVLAGWGNSTAQPWVVVVESTLPLTQRETHLAWENFLLERGYQAIYFDGLNRFYISPGHPELAQAFGSGPNVFDGFALHGTASAPFCARLNERQQQQQEVFQQEVSRLQQSHAQQLAQQELLAQQTTQRLSEEAQAHSDSATALMSQIDAVRSEQQRLQQEQVLREKEHAEQTRQARQELEGLLRTLAQREKEVAAQLLALQQQVEKEKAEQAAIHSEQAHALRLDHAEREQALSQQLQAGQQELRRLEQERVLGEKEHAERTRQARQELEGLLRSVAQREQLHSQQLLQLQQESEQAKERQARAHAEREQELQRQINSARSEQHQLEREQRTLVSELAQKHDKALQELRQQHVGQLNTAASRERELVAQLLQHQQQAQLAKDEHVKAVRELERSMARTLAQRDQALQQQAKAAQQEAQRLALAWADKEKSLARQAAEAAQQARDEKEGLLRAQVQREQAFTLQLLDAHETLAKQAAEQARGHSEQVHALHREHAEREQARAAQLHAEQLELRRLQQDWAQHENALNREIAALQNETQALRHAQQLQTQQHGFELSTQQDEHRRLTQSHAALEARLKAEILAEQQTAARLRQALAEVQQALETTHATLTWRLTAPLRQLALLIFPRKMRGFAFPLMGKAQPPHALVPTDAEAPQVHVQQQTVEPFTMPSISVTTTTPVVATTLDELLACHDQHFVSSAYQTLLGREPDPEGLGYYLGRLRTGYSKMRIVAQVRLSQEGKTHPVQLPGLDAAIQRYKRGQHPLLGGLFRWLDGSEDDRATERKLRGIENQLSLLSDESNRRFNQMETMLRGLHHLIVQQTQFAVAVPGGTPQFEIPPASRVAHPSEPDSLISAASDAREPDRLKPLSRRGRNIYSQLKAAVAIHSGRSA